MEDQKALKRGAVVCRIVSSASGAYTALCHTSNAANAVNNAIHNFLSNRVVTTSICKSISVLLQPSLASEEPTIIRSIFLSTNQQLWMKQLAVGTSAYLINRLQARLASSDGGGRSDNTDGSRSTKIERGTYFPFPVSVKNVSKEPGSPMSLASESGNPSGLRPCSRR